MSYNQGTGDLQRSKVAGAVTLGSSNGAASMTLNGTRGTIAVTLNGTLASDAEIGVVTWTNNSIKATSVIETCVKTNHACNQFDIWHVADGSCKFGFMNNTGDDIESDPTITFQFMVYN